MRSISVILCVMLLVSSCKLSNTNPGKTNNSELAALFNNYWEGRMKLFPLEATAIGDNRYNNLLPVDFTDNYRDSLRSFFAQYKNYISKYDRENLGDADKISFDIFKREMDMNLEGLTYKDNLMPANQFYALPLSLGQLGSGTGNQPFKTVKDFDDWLQRLQAFTVWTDSAIVYFRKGIETGNVLPHALVIKMVPEMQAMQTSDATSSLFYGPVSTMPSSFSQGEKDRLTTAFKNIIQQQVIPSYKKLGDFLQNEYLPKSRNTSGISSLPGGTKYYDFLTRLLTTTNKSAGEIYKTGLSEVARIRKLQDSVKNVVGFKGDLQAFFEFMKVDKQFMPYKTPEEILKAFGSIHNLDAS